MGSPPEVTECIPATGGGTARSPPSNVLGTIGMGDALSVIKDVITGHLGAHPTVVAKAVLKRRRK